MDIVKQLESFHSQMTTKELETTDRILNNLKPLSKDSAKDAAKAYHTSPAMLVRLAKKIGLSGYSEFSFQTQLFLNKNKAKKKEVSKSGKFAELINTFSDYVKKIPNNLDQKNINKLITKMHNANRTFVVGSGYTGLVTDYLKFMFLSNGVVLNCFDNMGIIKHIHQSLTKKDLIIVFSASGAIKQYNNIYKTCKKNHISLAIVTMNANLPALKDAEFGFVLPTVSLITDDLKVQSIDSQPIFWIFASCLTQLYKDRYLQK